MIRGGSSARTASTEHIVGRSATMWLLFGRSEAISWSVRRQFVVVKQQNLYNSIRVSQWLPRILGANCTEIPRRRLNFFLGEHGPWRRVQD